MVALFSASNLFAQSNSPTGGVQEDRGRRGRGGFGDPAEMRQKKVAEYKEKFANPYVAASKGYIDAVIEPSETRPKLIRALERLGNKVDGNPKKKHGNIPL